MPLKAFISYAHDNRNDLEDLLKYLKPLEEEGLLAPWSDGLIDFGALAWRGRSLRGMRSVPLAIGLEVLGGGGDEPLDPGCGFASGRGRSGGDFLVAQATINA